LEIAAPHSPQSGGARTALALEESEKGVQMDHLRTKPSFGKKIVKIGPVDPIT